MDYIIRHVRIPELEEFYASSEMSLKNISIDEFPKGIKLTDEAKGQWAIEQFSNAARSLNVLPFIIPLDQEKSREVPFLNNSDFYVKRELELLGPTLEHLQKTLPRKKERMDLLSDECDMMKLEIDRLDILSDESVDNASAEKISPPKSQRSNRKSSKVALDRNAPPAHDNKKVDGSDSKVLSRDYTRTLENWQRSEDNYRQTLSEINKIYADASRAGAQAQSRDLDARVHLINALSVLKNYLALLFKKFKDLEEVCRSSNITETYDPYEQGNMRQVYANMIHKYRKQDELGVIATIVSFMGEKQGSKTLTRWMTQVEEFHIALKRLDVDSVPVGDLCALLALSGMAETNRKAFFSKESILNLAAEDRLDTVGHDMHSDSISLGSVSRKKHLFERVRHFVRKERDISDISDKFRGQKDGDDTKSLSSERESDNRQIYAASVTTSKKVDQKTCDFFARNGTCRFGDKCKFAHSSESTSVKNINAGMTPKGTNEPGAKVMKQISKAGKHDDLFLDEDTSHHVVRVSDITPTQSYTVRFDDINTRLYWDCCSEKNVAGDHRVAASNVREVTNDKMASGIGGSRKILRVADSEIFNEPDFLHIEGTVQDGTPNLLAVHSAIVRDSERLGGKGIFQFTDKGAVRYVADKQCLEIMAAEVRRAVDEGRFIGRANVTAGGLYAQDFEVKKSSRSGNSSSHFAVSTSAYSGRLALNNAQNLIGILLSAGISCQALLDGIETGTIKGIPPELTSDTVRMYYESRGLDIDQLSAQISKAPLKQPIDYEESTSDIPGSVLSIDAIDPSFSRSIITVSSPSSDTPSNTDQPDKVHKAKKVIVKSLGGFVNAVVGSDNATGYIQLVGRQSNKDPHLIIKDFAMDWIIRWRTLRMIKCDSEFVTEATWKILRTIQFDNNIQLRVRQAPPGEHAQALGSIEGTNRWVQDGGQAHMNRLPSLVKSGELSVKEAQSFWYHACRLSAICLNLKKCKHDKFKLRFTSGTGEVFSLSKYPMLPFVTKVVARKLLYDNTGRGEVGLYLGPSMVVWGGILFYSLVTRSLSVKYSFVAREYIPLLSDLDVEQGVESLYGGLVDTSYKLPVILSESREDEQSPEHVESDDHSDVQNTDVSLSKGDSVTGIKETSDIELLDEDTDKTLNDKFSKKDEVSLGMVNVANSSEDINQEVTDTVAEKTMKIGQIGMKMKDFNIDVPSCEDPYKKVYKTSASRRRNMRISAVSERPPKPNNTPTSQQAKRMPQWQQARVREYSKFNEENALELLDYDVNGEVIIPDGSITMRVIELYEFKWKPDPETKVERWLECMRAVVDGSQDKREADFYAETPSRNVFLMMASVDASLGIHSKIADAVRAYLNADSIDNNLIVTLPFDVERMGLGLKRTMKVRKGIYGTRSAALSWENWFNNKAVNCLQFNKCLIAKSVYLKLVDNEPVRLLRHSDDCRMSCSDITILDAVTSELSKLVKLSPWKSAEMFLGCSIEYGEGVVLLRQSDKIKATGVKCEQYITKYNPKRRLRFTRLPSNALINDEELSTEMRLLLNTNMITEYQRIVGSMNWVSLLRFDFQFPQHVVAGRMAKPREWDFYCLVWYVEYAVRTADYPLVLGGPIVDPEVMSDASFGTMPEKRSVISHFVRMGPASGAVMASTETIKVAVTSVWDAEVQAASHAVDSLSYTMNVMDELLYNINRSRKVRVDSESGIEWFHSNKVNEKSRHVQIRYYHTKHSVQEGIVNMEFCDGEENESDLNTKICDAKRTLKLTRKILGHYLVLGQGYEGVIELESDSSDEKIDYV